MGCGGSKLEPEQEAVPVRLRPILRRRLEEIRSRRNRAAANEVAMSKNELLGDGSSPENKFHQTQDCPPTLQKITSTEKKSPSSLSSSSSSSPKSPSHHNQNSNVENMKPELAEKNSFLAMEDKSGNNDDDNDNKEIEEGKDVNHNKSKGSEDEESPSPDNFLYCPNSPSFRVYCVDTVDRITSDQEGLHGLLEADEMVEDQRISTSDESISSNEVSVKQPQKKPKKGTMFRKMMSKGATSKCYNFACSADNSHLLQKAAA